MVFKNCYNFGVIHSSWISITNQITIYILKLKWLQNDIDVLNLWLSSGSYLCAIMQYMFKLNIC